MAHLLAPKPTSEALPVFFNVDGVVGASPSENRREDVLLVQFYYHVMGRHVTSKDRAIYQAVPVSGVICPSDNNDPTIKAIREHQSSHSSAPDGRVSRAGTFFGMGSPWTIFMLNAQVQIENRDVWPRIDKIIGCPGELITMVNRELIGRGLGYSNQ